MSRSIAKTIAVDAPPDAVWRALTDAAELTRWFPVEARVEPGAGGSIWLSWGGGDEGEAPITAWEPGRHLQWTEDRGAVKLAIDFHIEAAAGGGTVVRLVQSGFGDGPDWDGEFHMTDGGWTYFMHHLRWYLERHRGTPRDLIVCRDAVALPPPDAFARLVAAAREWSRGPVVLSSAGTCQFGLEVPELDALLFIEIPPHKTGSRPGCWLSTYGLGPARIEDVRAQITKMYRRALALVPACHS